MTSDDLMCPLCQGVMEHKPIPKEKKTSAKEHTHVWVCEACPGVLLEWIDGEDTKSFVDKFGRAEALGSVIEAGELFTQAKKMNAQLAELEQSIALLLGIPTFGGPPASDWLSEAAKTEHVSVRLLLQKHHDLEAELHALHERKYVEVGEG